MYCSKCGTQINENAKFCQKCGTAVANAVSTENFHPTPANNPYATASAPAPMQDVNAQPLSAAAAPCEKPSAKAKVNPFAFVSAGIMGLMLILYFCPWFFHYGTMSDVFGYYIDHLPLVYPDDTAVILFLIFSFIGMGMSVAGIVTALIRKRRVPLVFALVFFCFTKEAWTIGVSAAPVILFLITYINIACAIPARVR